MEIINMESIIYVVAMGFSLGLLVVPIAAFGQLLINSGILEMKWNTLLDNERFDLVCNDPFYEEPEITWNRMCKNKFCFNNENV